jgi:ribonuclease BN (tRNA processing enzyme)
MQWAHFPEGHNVNAHEIKPGVVYKDANVTSQLAELATKAKPRLLILYHASIAWRPVVDNQRSRPEVLLSEIISKYSGHVVVGRDLDVY